MTFTVSTEWKGSLSFTVQNAENKRPVFGQLRIMVPAYYCRPKGETDAQTEVEAYLENDKFDRNYGTTKMKESE